MNKDFIYQRQKKTRKLTYGKVLIKNLSIGIFSVVALATGVTYATKALKTSDLFAIDAIKVVGKLNHLDKEELKVKLEPQYSKGFFALDVAKVQRSLRKMAWIKEVSVKRVFPSTLVIDIKEQEPKAYWGANAFINTDGDLFFPSGETILDLPRLRGPEGHNDLVWQKYLEMNAKLAAINLSVQELELAPRGAWRVVLSNGMEVILGKSEVDDRLMRFIYAYRVNFAQQKDKIAYIDCRYTSGMAIGWKK